MFWDDLSGHVAAGVCAYVALAVSIFQVRACAWGSAAPAGLPRRAFW